MGMAERLRADYGEVGQLRGPVLIQGQADDCIAVFDDPRVRVWRSRVGLASGARFEHGVSAEIFDPGTGRWEPFGEWGAWCPVCEGAPGPDGCEVRP